MSDSTMFLVATISFRAVDKGSMFNSGAHTTRCPACAQYGTTYGPERGRARQSRQSRNQIVLVVVLLLVIEEAQSRSRTRTRTRTRRRICAACRTYAGAAWRTP